MNIGKIFKGLMITGYGVILMFCVGYSCSEILPVAENQIHNDIIVYNVKQSKRSLSDIQKGREQLNDWTKTEQFKYFITGVETNIGDDVDDLYNILVALTEEALKAKFKATPDDQKGALKQQISEAFALGGPEFPQKFESLMLEGSRFRSHLGEEEKPVPEYSKEVKIQILKKLLEVC